MYSGVQVKTVPLLHETHIRSRSAAFRRFLDVPKLRFVPREILSERPPDAFGVARADDRAGQQLALRAVGKNVDKIQRELFQIVMNHHQVAVLPLQFLFVRFDLYLALRWLLLVHLVPLPESRIELTTSTRGSLAPLARH